MNIPLPHLLIRCNLKCVVEPHLIYDFSAVNWLSNCLCAWSVSMIVYLLLTKYLLWHVCFIGACNFACSTNRMVVNFQANVKGFPFMLYCDEIMGNFTHILQQCFADAGTSMWLHVKAMSDCIEFIYRENFHTKTMHNKTIKNEKNININ